MIQLHLFGAISIHDLEGNDLRSALAQSKRTAIVAYLAIARPRASHRRETLLALFWPDLSEDRARRALNQAVYYLRSKLGPGSIFVRAGDEIGLSRERVLCDVVEFERLLDAGEEEKALTHYRGPLLRGFHLNGLLEFERWVEAERSRLHDRAAHAAWILADRAAVAGIAPEAIAWARRSMELSRGEASVRHLISMRDRFGDRAGAIREYDRFARQLAAELEVDPSPETRDLIAQIRLRSGSVTPAIGTVAVLSSAVDDQVPQRAPTAQTQTPKAGDPDLSPEKRAERKRLAFLGVSAAAVAVSGWLVRMIRSAAGK